MTPVYLNPSSTSPFSPYNIHIVEQAIDEDQRLKLLNTSSTLPYQSFASSSLISFPTFFHSSDNQRRTYGSSNTTTFGDQALLYYQRVDDKLVWHGEQICDQACTSETLVRPVVNVSSDEYTDKINLEDHVRNIDEPMKHWTSSDMRLKQKTNSFMDHQLPDHKFQSVHHDDFQHQENNIGQTTTSSLAVSINNRSGSSTASGVRVCSDCSTSTTPLWRSGPRGPKTLCNACGIRQRKARRAMADAAAAANVSALCTNQTAIAASSMSKSKEKKSLGNHNVTERCNSNKRKIDTANTASLTCYKTTNNKHKAASPQSVLFPQDVAEAAMMLMELSSGLMNHS